MRPVSDTEERNLDLIVDLSPDPTPPPDDWLKPGTVLYYGLSFDEKPITKEVPLALTVRIGAGSDGSRVLTWKADIDPLAEEEYTTERTRTGRKLILRWSHPGSGWMTASLGERTSRMPTASSCPRHNQKGDAARRRPRARRGGRPQRGSWCGRSPSMSPCRRTPRCGAFRGGRVDRGGSAVYVIAEDPTNPLILSARRPGYIVRLMAIGQPSPRR